MKIGNYTLKEVVETCRSRLSCNADARDDMICPFVDICSFYIGVNPNTWKDSLLDKGDD